MSFIDPRLQHLMYQKHLGGVNEIHPESDLVVIHEHVHVQQQPPLRLCLAKNCHLKLEFSRNNDCQLKESISADQIKEQNEWMNKFS